VLENNMTYLTIRGNFGLWDNNPDCKYQIPRMVGRLVKDDVFLVVDTEESNYKILTKHGAVWLLGESVLTGINSKQFQIIG